MVDIELLLRDHYYTTIRNSRLPHFFNLRLQDFTPRPHSASALALVAMAAPSFHQKAQVQQANTPFD